MITMEMIMHYLGYDSEDLGYNSEENAYQVIQELLNGKATLKQTKEEIIEHWTEETISEV